MMLKTIQKIAIGICCVGVIAFSSLSVFTADAIALPESTPLAAMEEAAEDATTKVQETASDAQKAVEEGVEKASQKAQEAKETVESKTEEGIEKTKEAADQAASEAKENGENIVDKVKSLFTGE